MNKVDSLYVVSVDDTTGTVIQEGSSISISLLQYLEDFVLIMPIVAIIIGFAWAITKTLGIKNSKKRAKEIFSDRAKYVVLACGALLPIIELWFLWDKLFPPQCGDSGTVLGGPEHCIVGASFGGIIAIPLMMISASFLLALVYKLFVAWKKRN